MARFFDIDETSMKLKWKRIGHFCGRRNYHEIQETKKWDCFCVVVSPHKTIKTLQRWIVWKPTIPSLQRNWPWIKVINLSHYFTGRSSTIIWSLIQHFCLRPGVANRRCRCRHCVEGTQPSTNLVLTKHWNRFGPICNKMQSFLEIKISIKNEENPFKGSSEILTHHPCRLRKRPGKDLQDNQKTFGRV